MRGSDLFGLLRLLFGFLGAELILQPARPKDGGAVTSRNPESCWRWSLPGGVPVSPVASNLEPTRPKTRESPTFLNILNNEALLRIAQIFL